MPFGFGGSQQQSQSSSRSSSSSFDNLDAFGVNVGGSSATQGSQSTQSVAFQDLFAQLFGGASATAGGIDTSVTTDAANLLFGGGTDFLNTLAGGGAGAEFLEARLAGSDDLVNEQIGLLGEDIGTFLAEQVNPAIKESGVRAGSLGGGRGEVQKGIASGKATDAFVRGATDIRARERAATDQIAQALAQDETTRAGTGLDSLGGLLDIVRTGNLASLDPLTVLAQIMGPATTLTDASSFGVSDSFDFGIDSTTGRAASQSSSSSSSSSRGRSFNFGFGE